MLRCAFRILISEVPRNGGFPEHRPERHAAGVEVGRGGQFLFAEGLLGRAVLGRAHETAGRRQARLAPEARQAEVEQQHAVGAVFPGPLQENVGRLDVAVDGPPRGRRRAPRGPGAGSAPPRRGQWPPRAGSGRRGSPPRGAPRPCRGGRRSRRCRRSGRSRDAAGCARAEARGAGDRGPACRTRGTAPSGRHPRRRCGRSLGRFTGPPDPSGSRISYRPAKSAPRPRLWKRRIRSCAAGEAGLVSSWGRSSVMLGRGRPCRCRIIRPRQDSEILLAVLQQRQALDVGRRAVRRLPEVATRLLDPRGGGSARGVAQEKGTEPGRRERDVDACSERLPRAIQVGEGGGRIGNGGVEVKARRPVVMDVPLDGQRIQGSASARPASRSRCRAAWASRIRIGHSGRDPQGTLKGAG